MATFYAIKDGNLWVWGNGTFGQIGNSNNLTVTEPFNVSNTDLGKVKTANSGKIPTLNSHNILIGTSPNFIHGWRTMSAISTSDELWTWGSNFWGTVGDGTTTNALEPFNVSAANGGAIGKVRDYEIIYTSYAISTSDELWTWGFNSSGQVGNNTITHALTPFNVSSAIGTVKEGGFKNGSSYAISTSDELWMWGPNEQGQVGNGTTTNALEPFNVSAANANAMGPVKYFEVFTPDPNEGSTDARFAAINVIDELFMWGRNDLGQLGDGTTINASTPINLSAANGGEIGAVKSVKMTHHNTFAITQTDQLWVWGENANGQIGNGAIAASPVLPYNISANSSIGNVLEADMVKFSGLAINTSNELWMWGYGGQGNLGQNNTSNSLVPVKVLDLGTTVKTAGFSEYNITDHITVFAISQTDELFMWGTNDQGQVGNGTTNNAETPFNVSATNDGAVGPVDSVKIYNTNSVIIAQNGDVYVFGLNTSGMLGTGDTLSVKEPLNISETLGEVESLAFSGDPQLYETLLVVTKDSVFAAGENDAWQVGNGTAVTPVLSFYETIKPVVAKKKIENQLTVFRKKNDSTFFALIAFVLLAMFVVAIFASL